MSGWSDATRWMAAAAVGLALLGAFLWLVWALRRGSRDGERARSLAEQADALARARDGERTGQRLAGRLRRLWLETLRHGDPSAQRELPDGSPRVLPADEPPGAPHS